MVSEDKSSDIFISDSSEVVFDIFQVRNSASLLPATMKSLSRKIDNVHTYKTLF